jgi:hypothetical protein
MNYRPVFPSLSRTAIYNTMDLPLLLSSTINNGLLRSLFEDRRRDKGAGTY